jgi:cell division protein FtsB
MSSIVPGDDGRSTMPHQRERAQPSTFATAVVAFLVAVPTTFGMQTLLPSRQVPVAVAPPLKQEPIKPELNREPEQRERVVVVADPNANGRVVQLERRIGGLEKRLLELAPRKMPAAAVPAAAEAGDGDGAAVLKLLQTINEQLDEQGKRLKAHSARIVDQDKLLNNHAMLLATADKNVRDALLTADKNLKDTFALADHNLKVAFKEGDRNVRSALTLLGASDAELSAEIAGLRRQLASVKQDVTMLAQQVATLRR